MGDHLLGSLLLALVVFLAKGPLINLFPSKRSSGYLLVMVHIIGPFGVENHRLPHTAGLLLAAAILVRLGSQIVV